MLSVIRECTQAGAPVLGFRLGAQLIERAFEQRVYRFGGPEVGYPTVHLTAAGRTDPLFQGLKPEQHIMQMHEDSFDLPGSPYS
jgi:GMP synthase (glutamine-hydrolysing)